MEFCSISHVPFDECDQLHEDDCVWQCGDCGGNVYNCICDQQSFSDFIERGAEDQQEVKRLDEIADKQKFALFRVLEFASRFDGIDDDTVRQAFEEFDRVYDLLLRKG